MDPVSGFRAVHVKDFPSKTAGNPKEGKGKKIVKIEWISVVIGTLISALAKIYVAEILDNNKTLILCAASKLQGTFWNSNSPVSPEDLKALGWF